MNLVLYSFFCVCHLVSLSLYVIYFVSHFNKDIAQRDSWPIYQTGLEILDQTWLDWSQLLSLSIIKRFFYR